jgi:hypothetical protein
MKWLSFLLVAGVACTRADGTRGQCAAGGTLEQCPEAERTPEGACWKLVDCAVIPLKADDPNRQFDWNDCVDDIATLTSDRERLVINCIAAGTCDSLQTNPNACFTLGEGP